jgi:hypothetical protein
MGGPVCFAVGKTSSQFAEHHFLSKVVDEFVLNVGSGIICFDVRSK